MSDFIDNETFYLRTEIDEQGIDFSLGDTKRC